MTVPFFSCAGYALLPHRHLQDDIKVMWEPNVVAAQVEPYVTDYGIDTVSYYEGTPQFFSTHQRFHIQKTSELKLTRTRTGNLC